MEINYYNKQHITDLINPNNKSNLIKEIKINGKITEAFNDYFINIGTNLASD